ncbi:MAG: DEAD/DEAH box helicase [Wenzhouxiangella sp.]
MPYSAAQRARPRHRLLYLLQLSAGSELSVSPVRAPLAGIIGERLPFSLSILEQEARPSYVADEDYRILHELAERAALVPGLTWHPLPSSAEDLFRAMLDSGRCYWESPEGPTLRASEPISAPVHWQLRADGSQQLQFDWTQTQLSGSRLQLPLDPPWVVNLDSGLCRPVRPIQEADRAIQLMAQGQLDPQRAQELIASLEAADSALPRPARLQLERVPATRPQPRLRLANVEVGSAGRFMKLPAVALSFGYGELELAWDHEGESKLLTTASDENLPRVLMAERDLAFEDACLCKLEGLNLERLTKAQGLDYAPGHGGLLVPARRDRLTASWIETQQALNALAERGWALVKDPELMLECVEPEAWRCRLADIGQDWIALDLQIDSQGQRLSLLHSVAAWARQATPMMLQEVAQRSARAIMLDVDDRRVLPLAAERLHRVLSALPELADADQRLSGGILRLRRGRLAELGQLEQDWTLAGDPALAEVARSLSEFEKIRPAQAPRGLAAELRDYQRLGLGWLQFLREAGFGGILADDMGLGKTIQALAHILLEKQSGRLNEPALVVAPTSLMFNWKNEARRFAPDLKTLLLHGPDRRGQFQWIEDSDLVLTTYPLLGRDIEWLKRERWHLLILDEAQAIKNARTRASKAVRLLNSRHRLCLTGTPLENNLSELWSQFDFLMPGLLGSDAQFRAHFRQPIEKGGDEARKSQLARRIRPFFLRRRKSEVAPELPPKTEILRSVPLAGQQLKTYEAVREAMQERVRRAFQIDGPERGRIVILDALLKLRQVCCDPRLLDPGASVPAGGSAKLALLMDLLPEMVLEGRRILLFSQFVRMLELIERELQQRAIPFLKLTGQTRDRQAVVEAFQSGQAPVFLISLRAGGVGLNLTAADTVIHYDPWWNPAVEDQATDRAHRIGQDQKVFVYRLMTEDTIEDKIQQMQANKRELITGLLGGGGAIDLSPEDLDVLFGKTASG